VISTGSSQPGQCPAQANGWAEAVAPVTSLPAEEALSAVLAFIHDVGCKPTSTAELGPEAVRPRSQLLAAREPEGRPMNNPPGPGGSAYGGGWEALFNCTGCRPSSVE
jgi:hypothetical protein